MSPETAATKPEPTAPAPSTDPEPSTAAGTTTAPETSTAPEQTTASVRLDEPTGGVPHVVESERELERAAAAIAAGSGPVAIDAERASGYRYGQRAYLVQVRRDGAGTWLIDPASPRKRGTSSI